MERKKILLMNGSPKKQNSTSFALGEYLLQKFSEDSYNRKVVYIYDALKDLIGIRDMIRDFNESDIIIFCYPLYVDTLPANDIKALELITEYRKKYKVQKNQKFLVISNCGFYEYQQLNNSINICHFFAKENELSWYGGVKIGAGPLYSGRNLNKMGGMSKRLRNALDLAAETIINNTALPSERINKLVVPAAARFIYSNAVNLNFKLIAKKNGVYKSLHSRPYNEG